MTVNSSGRRGVWLGLTIVLTILLGLISFYTENAAENSHKSKRKDLSSYTCYEDVSWAIRSADEPLTPLYADFMKGCQVEARKRGESKDFCLENERSRLRMNLYQPMSMRNYTTRGYAKLKAPPELFQLLQDFWIHNQHEQVEEWGNSLNVYHNMWEAPSFMVHVTNSSLLGGGPMLQRKIWMHAQAVLEDWTQQQLRSVSLWGIRVYKNNSILTPHVDRLPLVTSAIINVAQHVDEDWPLEVYDHNGVAVNITMEPGDMVLYESHSVIHGRPFPMRGRFYANAFLHFEPKGRPKLHDDKQLEDDNQGLPPYLIPYSPWVHIWRQDHPRDAHQNPETDPHFAAFSGDLAALQNLQKTHPHALFHEDPNGWQPLHQSIRGGHVDIIHFLVDQGADIHKQTLHGQSPLDVARDTFGSDHPIFKLVHELGTPNDEL